MNKRNWFLRLTATAILMLAGLSVFAAGNTSLYASNPGMYASPSNSPSSLGSSYGNTPVAPPIPHGHGPVVPPGGWPSGGGSTPSGGTTPADAPSDGMPTGNAYVNTPSDYSIKYLNMLFGNVGSTLHGSVTGQTIGHLFYIFNQGILIACGIWVLLTLVRIVGKLVDGNVQEISKEGKTFLSICLGIILVIPSPKTGYSTIQDIIMKVVVQGIRLADGIWDYQIDAFRNHRHVFDNPPQEQPWVNSNDSSPDYTYFSIMNKTLPNQVNKTLFSVLQQEIKYYQSEAQCKSQGAGACSDSSHPAHPLFVAPTSADSNAAGATDTSTITINGNYVGFSDGSPQVFKAYLSTADQQDPNTLKGLTNKFESYINPSSSGNLGSTASDTQTFSSELISAAQTLSSTAKSFACQDNSSDFCQGVPAVDLDNSANLLIGVSTTFANSITNAYGMFKLSNDPVNDATTSSTQCRARWETSDDIEKSYQKYEQELKEWNNMQNEIAQSNEAMSNLPWFKHAETLKQKNYDRYMGVGDIGAWGQDSTKTGSGPVRMATCEAAIVGNFPQKTGESADDYSKRRAWMCQNYGSILYQMDRTSPRMPDDRRQTLQNELNKADNAFNPDGMEKPTQLPNSNPDAKTVTCTEALANKMQSEGWIMAGSYYWLIAHQDQKIATINPKSDNYLDWSVGHKMFAALTAFHFDGGSDDDNNNNGGGSAVSVDDLQKQVTTNISQQFQNTGADIGQINTQDQSADGIAVQLAWAGNAFNNIISGEANGINSFTKGQTLQKMNQNDLTDKSRGGNQVKNVAKGSPGFFGTLYSVEGSLFPQLINQVYYLQKFILNVANQLNNPNIDPQSLLASIGIGMIYQGGYATLGYYHMMIEMVIVAIVAVVALTLCFLIPCIGGIVSMIGSAFLALLISFVKIMGGILKKIGLTFVAMGVIMAFYVPIYPWIVFTFAAVGWFIAVIEAMAAGPLICLGMTHPQGHELANSVRQAAMLLLGVFIRPALMILSFIMSMILARVLLFFMIQGFLMLLGTLFDGNASDYCKYIFNGNPSLQTPKCDGSAGTNLNLWNSMFNLSAHAADIGQTQYQDTIHDPMPGHISTADKMLTPNIPDQYKTKHLLDGRPGPAGYQGVFQFFMMMISMPVMLGILTYMTYKIINHAYSLIFLVPENVLKWIGTQQSAGDTRAMMQSVQGAKGSASQSAKGASKGMGQTTDGGAQMGSSTFKAGGAVATKAVGDTSQALKGGMSKGGGKK